MAVAYIGIGSNIGNVHDNCLKGIKDVTSDERAEYLALSSLYRTSPVSPISQNDFLNCALKIRWKTSPRELLSFLLALEDKMGRTRNIPLGPRILDLDILLFDQLVIETADLIVPHPRLHERKFTLVPCLEIDPHLVHPRLGDPLVQFLKRLGDDQRITLEKRITEEEVHACRTSAHQPNSAFRAGKNKLD